MGTFKDKSKIYTTINVIIFITAIALRIALSLVNLEANDDHMQVCRIIANQGHLPVAEECEECFHPKLFHTIVAIGINLGHLSDWKAQTRLAQLISCLAGVLTIALCYYFLAGQSLLGRVKLLTFAMVALNPSLIAINAQATNDSLAIFFSTCMIYFAYRFLCKGGLWYFVVMAIFCILAGLTKSDTLVLFPTVLFILALKVLTSQGTIIDKIKHRFNWYMLVFCAFFLVIVPLGGQYVRKNSHEVTQFLSIHDQEYPLPNFFKETYYGRPGITSVVNSYLTFRLVDMLKHPTISNGEKAYPLHRTSFWSQLYGRVNFVYFGSWPRNWMTTAPANLNLGRAILVLALIPACVFLWGFLKEMGLWGIAIVRFDGRLISMSNKWVFSLFATAQIIILLYCTAIYREFSFIKDIYLFPSLLAATHIFTVGLSSVYRGLDKTLWRVWLDLVFGILIVLYSLSVLSLIMKLLTRLSCVR